MINLILGIGFFVSSYTAFAYFRKAAERNAFITFLVGLVYVGVAILFARPIYSAPAAPIADSARVIVADHRLSAVNKEAIGNEQQVR